MPSTISARRSFHSAAFGPDGELIGAGEWELQALSSKWISVCQSILDLHGPSFRTNLDGPLRHIEMEITAANGAALGMFYANGILGISAAYFRGESFQAESQLQRMLLESLSQTAIVRELAQSSEPFHEVRALNQRPLHVFIPWGEPNINESDYALLHELANHIAAAFLCGGESAA